MTRETITLDGRPVNNQSMISLQKLIDDKELYLNTDCCITLMQSCASTTELDNLSKSLSILEKQKAETGILDVYLAQGLISDLCDDANNIGLKDAFLYSFNMIIRSAQECFRTDRTMTPIMKAPRESLMLNLLSKKNIMELDKNLRITLVSSMTAVAYISNCFNLQKSFDNYYDKVEIVDIKNPRENRTIISDFRHSIEHSRVSIRDDKLFFTNKYGDYSATLSIPIDCFIYSTLELIKNVDTSMKKTDKNPTADEIKALETSIRKGEVFNNTALSLIIMQIIASIYESHSEAFEGILSLGNVLKTGVKTDKYGLRIENCSVKGIRNNSAHTNNYAIDGNKLVFIYKGNRYIIDLNDCDKALKTYRVACTLPQMIIMCLCLKDIAGSSTPAVNLIPRK